VLFIPAGFTFIWMTVFGNTAMFIDTGIAAGEVGQAIAADISTGLFHFFQYLPFSGLTSTLAIILVAIFFITSSDSGSLVVDSIAAGGETETTTGQRVFWCVMEGVVAASLLLAGGLGALQSATIASALPFTFVMLGLVWSLVLGMRSDLAQQYAHPGSAAPVAPAQPAAGVTWQRRLALMMRAPSKDEVEAFITREVRPALEQVARELTDRGRPANMETDEAGNIALRSPAEGQRDFVYGVGLASMPIANFAPLATGRPEQRYEARTYFSSGGRGYDVMGLHREQLIADILVQFERYLHLTHSPASQLLHGAPEHTSNE
jgi:choline/glycine/proline betaine transport protein